MVEKYVWLIEKGPGCAPMYLTSDFGWTRDAFKAHRFQAEQDAMAYRRRLFQDEPDLRVCEHVLEAPA